MNKNDLAKMLASDIIDTSLCHEFIEATLMELSKLLHSGKGVKIEGVGIFDSHYRKTRSIQDRSDRIEESSDHLSIFFHPSHAVKDRAKKIDLDAISDKP